MLCYVKVRYDVLCYVMLRMSRYVRRCVMLCCVMPCDSILYSILFYSLLLRKIVIYSTISYYTVLHDIILYNISLKVRLGVLSSEEKTARDSDPGIASGSAAASRPGSALVAAKEHNWIRSCLDVVSSAKSMYAWALVRVPLLLRRLTSFCARPC